jgi:hypothetical protein
MARAAIGQPLAAAAQGEGQTGPEIGRLDAEDGGHGRLLVAVLAERPYGLLELDGGLEQLLVGHVNGQVEAAHRAVDGGQSVGRRSEEGFFAAAALGQPGGASLRGAALGVAPQRAAPGGVSPNGSLVCCRSVRSA